MHKNSWVKPLTYTLIILIGPLLAYYLVYVQSRSEILLNRSFSHLANITQLTEARFDSVGDVLRNACRRPTSTDESPYIANEVIEKSDFGLELGSSGRSDSIDRAPCYEPGSSQFTISRNSLRFGLAADGSTWVEQATRDPSLESSEEVNTEQEYFIDARTNDIVGDIDLGEIFYDILIFKNYNENSEGSVIYQKNPENGRIESAESLIEGNRLRASTPADSGTEIVRDPLEEMRINYRGESFLMLSQPLQVSFGGGANQSQNWTMVGLIEESNFNSEKLQFQPATVALFTLIVAAVALSAPFLKIWNMGRYESFKRLDLVFLIISGFTLCSLISLVFIEYFNRKGTQAFMDERLEQISYEIRSDIHSEIKLALEELQLAESTMRHLYEANTAYVQTGQQRRSSDCPYLAGDELEGQDGRISSATVRGHSNFGGDLLTGYLGYVPTTYPFFNQLYLMDRNGCQISKFGTRANPTNASQFEDRAYFLGSLIHPRLPHQGFSLPDDNEERFFLEFITSRTTGEKSVAISIPVPANDPHAESIALESPAADCLASTASNQKPCVAVMTASTFRALQPVLPYGFGIALTDSNSELLFHHEGRSNTEIDLAEEIGDGSLLKSALLGNNTRPFSSDYHGQVHRFRVLPLQIQGADMALVTFYSEDMAQMPLLESAGVSVVTWLSLFALLLFIIFLVLQAMKQRGLRFTSSSKLLRFVRRYTVLDMAVFLGIAAMVSIIPTFVLFNTVYNEASAGFYQLQLSSHERELRLQDESIRQWVAGRTTANDAATLANLEAGQDFRGESLTETWKQYPLFSSSNADNFSCRYDPHSSGEELQSLSLGQRLARYLLRRIPDFSDDTTQLHAMYRNLKLVDGDQNCNTSMIRAALVPTDIPPRYPVYFILLLVVVLLLVSLRYVLLRVLGIENYFQDYEFVPPGRNSGGRHVVFGGNDASRAALFHEVDAARVEWIDLRTGSEQEVLETIANRDEAKDIVVLDHFDDRLNDEATAFSRVATLEKLVRHSGISIVVMTSIDLITYVTATYRDSEHKQLVTRMASVMSQFSLSTCPVKEIKALGNNLADRALREECVLPELYCVYESIHQHVKYIDLDRDQIVELVKSNASAIYQNLWNLSTRSEKIMLIELANENLINPNNWDVALRLYRRGLLKRDPLHRICNESFKQFILRMARIENVAAWREDSGSNWQNIRAPLYVLVIGATVFLAATQPSFVNSVVAFAAAGAASMPFLINLIMQRLSKETGK